MKGLLVIIFILLFILDLKSQNEIYTVSKIRTVTVDSSQNPTITIIYADLKVKDSIHALLKNKVRYLVKFYQSKFELAFPSDFQIKLTVIADFAKYRNVVDSMSGTKRSNIGVYFRQHKEAFVSTVSLIETFVHEASHALLDHSTKHIPAWLNEGLAEYFKQITILTDSLAVIPSKKIKLRELNNSVKKNSDFYDLRKYMTKNDVEWHNEPSRAEYYSFAWSIIAFMMDSNEGVILIRDLLPYKKFTSSKLTSLRLIDSFYGKKIHADNSNFEKFETDWQSWLNRSSYEDHKLDLLPVKENGTWRFMKKMTRKVG